MSIFAEIVFLLALITLVTVGVLDFVKVWRQRKREELRRERWVNNLRLIAAYCHAKGLAEGLDFDKSYDLTD